MADRKHYELPGYREHQSWEIASKQRLSAISEREAAVVLRKMRSWKAVCSFFNGLAGWKGVDDDRWRAMMN